MAVLGRSKAKKTNALVASVAVASLDTPFWTQLVGGIDSPWQTELWRLYNCVPEFARGANYVGQCCSRVRIYVAEVDDRGQTQKEVNARNPVSRLANTVLGGPENQAELLNLMGTAMVVSGEYWVLGLSIEDAEEDKWFVVQFNELKRLEDFFAYPGAQPQRQFAYSTGNSEYVLREGRDIIFRVWAPNPENTIYAMSSGRSLQMVLTELELLTQYIFAQIRSRLVSGGVWFLPSELSFPTDDGQPAGAESLLRRLYEGGKRNIKEFGSASQVIPEIVEGPADVIKEITDPIVFGSVLSESAMKLRDEARTRIAQGLEVAPEIITGMGDSTHWNGPMIEQSTVDSVIKPIMARICNSLTVAYLQPALRKLGKDPKKYRYWFDTAALVTRPNRLKETLELYTQDVVGWEEVLRAADLPDSAHISEEEQAAKLARKLLVSDSNLILIPELRKLAGLPIDNIAPDGQMPGQDQQPGIAGRAPAPPPPERTLDNINPTAQPERSTLPGAPNNAVPGTQDRQLTASISHGITVTADAACRQALEKVGKVLRRSPGGGQFKHVPFDQMHLFMPVDADRARALLSTSFGFIRGVMEDQHIPGDSYAIQNTLVDYCSYIISSGKEYEPQIMRGWLEREGLL